MKVVYQAYGREDILRQAQFSVLSLLCQTQHQKNLSFRIEIYTDQPAIFNTFFADFSEVTIQGLMKEQIQKWRGDIDFVHRVKIEILKEATHDGRSALFYCDSDTFFTKNPMELFSKVSAKTSLMHLCEAQIEQSEDRLIQKICKFLKDNHFNYNGEVVKIPAHIEMWNAGFIGLAPENLSWLQEMLDWTDIFYKVYPKHVMEQLAISYVLQTRSQILSADNVLTHYWAHKEIIQKKIDQFLLEKWPLKSSVAASLASVGELIDELKELALQPLAKPKKSFFNFLKAFRA